MIDMQAVNIDIVSWQGLAADRTRCSRPNPERTPQYKVKPGVHTNDFAPIHGRRARIHTAPAESTVDSTYCLPQALCEYGRADRESGRNR